MGLFDIFKKEPQPDLPVTKTLTRTFKVVGVTFDNEDGKNRQDILKKVAKGIREQVPANERYSFMTVKDQKENFEEVVYELQDIEFEIEFQEYEWEGKPAIFVVTDDGIIGNIAADDVDDFLQLPEETDFSCELTGGKARELTYDEYYEEVTGVEKYETTYGAIITARYDLTEE